MTRTTAPGCLLAFGALFCATATLVAVTPSHAVGLGVLAAVVAAVAVVVPVPAGLFAGAFAFLCLNGFLVNAEGVLSWHGTSDLWRLTVLVGVAASATLLAHGRRPAGTINRRPSTPGR